MTFNIKAAFKALEGRTYTGSDFWDVVARMYANNFTSLPAEADMNDLIMYARRHNWLEESPVNGDVVVRIPD